MDLYGKDYGRKVGRKISGRIQDWTNQSQISIGQTLDCANSKIYTVLMNYICLTYKENVGILKNYSI